MLTDTVSINYSVDLRLVSDLVNAPVDELEALNPSLLRMVTPPDTSFDLHLPAGTATAFEDKIASIPEGHRNSWRYHRLTAGDTLASVARTYHVSESDLAEVNQLNEGASLDGHGGAGGAGGAGGGALRAFGDVHSAPGRHAGVDRGPVRPFAGPAAAVEPSAGGREAGGGGAAGCMWPNQRRLTGGGHHRTTITAEDLHPHSAAKKGTAHPGKKKTHSSSTATASAKQK